MTTKPMTPALKRLREVAEMATPKWAATSVGMEVRDLTGSTVATCDAWACNERYIKRPNYHKIRSYNLAHIATFSPTTVLALLDLVELYRKEFRIETLKTTAVDSDTKRWVLSEEAALLARLGGEG